MIRSNLANVGLNLHVAMLAAAVSVAGCIDVGHRAEIGCLVDMTEPGCMPPSAEASVIDAGRDSTSRPDAPQGDGASEAESAASTEADADAGAITVIDGPSDASSDASVTDVDNDATPGD